MPDTLQNIKLVLFQEPVPKSVGNSLVDYYDEWDEPLVLDGALLATPIYQQHRFARFLLAKLQNGALAEGTQVSVHHGHKCPYHPDVPFVERQPCTCGSFILVY